MNSLASEQRCDTCSAVRVMCTIGRRSIWHRVTANDVRIIVARCEWRAAGLRSHRRHDDTSIANFTRCPVSGKDVRAHGSATCGAFKVCSKMTSKRATQRQLDRDPLFRLLQLLSPNHCASTSSACLLYVLTRNSCGQPVAAVPSAAFDAADAAQRATHPSEPAHAHANIVFHI